MIYGIWEFEFPVAPPGSASDGWLHLERSQEQRKCPVEKAVEVTGGQVPGQTVK